MAQRPDFEKALDDFLDRREYDQAANALYSMVRIAFLAGWKAAGGDPPTPQKVVELLPRVDVIHADGGIETDLTLDQEDPIKNPT
jgi:hypothetical protein